VGPPLPHLLQNWAHPCHICTGVGLTPAKHLRLPHLQQSWAHPAPCHICTGARMRCASHVC
jgi:hypothetical protein